MQVQRKKYKDWPSKVKIQLRSLNYRQGGYMRNTLRENTAWTYVILDKEVVIAWAIVGVEHATHPRPSYESMFYTRQSHRKRGLANKIAARIRRDYSRSNINFPWSLTF